MDCGIRQGLDALSALPRETVGRLASLGCGDPDATLDSAKEFYAAARAMNESDRKSVV